ncbi:translocation/assembly module TamB domain-containing protein [Actinokineospora bangkokensis]|uniref:Oxidoreductase n=1 Tax=Actinokineospora bangkokensis TaxID=1193682 RepID=A0A1Q9LLW0_9PSEU|nr:hypothetical protein [Actinokineospora bangkokensis]OLR93027.1 hypothetical protein BJP25_18905 [Actinokineospora bangkokensis]
MVEGELTGAERAVVAAAARGGESACPRLRPHLLAISTDESHLVRAAVLRSLLLGELGPTAPRGVRLRGARVLGPLDLDHVSAATGLVLRGCVLDDPMTAEFAHLPFLDLDGSELAELRGVGLRVDRDLGLRAVTARGPLWLLRADVGGDLDLRAARLRGAPALLLDRARVGGVVAAGGLVARGDGAPGVVRAVEARVAGRFELSASVLANTGGPALLADGLRLGGRLALDDAVLRGTGDLGAVRIPQARVGGTLDAEGALVRNDSGPALLADAAAVDGSVLLGNTTLTGDGPDGTVRLLGARVEQQVVLGHARVTNTTGPALQLDGARVGTAVLAPWALLRGTSTDGAVRLVGARLRGQLVLDDAQVVNFAGPAVDGERLHVQDDVFLRGVRLRGSGPRGTLRLAGAKLSDGLFLAGTSVVNDHGPALSAAGVRVGDSLDLSTAHLDGRTGGDAVVLTDAHLGTADLRGTTITNAGGAALDMRGSTTTGDLDLAGLTLDAPTGLGLAWLRVGGRLDLTGLASHHPRLTALLDLTGTRVEADLLLDADAVTGDQTVDLDGTAFAGTPLDAGAWLALLRDHSPGYRPRAFRHVADLEAAKGHHTAAWRLRWAQHRARRR